MHYPLNQERSRSDNFERTFHFKELKTNTKRETVAGLTTFVSMAYILFVNANILGEAGMDKGAVFTATALSAIIGCTLLFDHYPISFTSKFIFTLISITRMIIKINP